MFGLENLLGGSAQGVGSFFGGLIGSPFRAAASGFRGFVDSTWDILKATALFTGVKLLLPDLWKAGIHAVGGQELADKTAKRVKEGGIPGVAWDSLVEAGTLVGGFGAAKGVIESTTGQQEGAGGLGTIIGAGAVVTVGALVALNHFAGKDGAKPAGDAGNGAKQPGATPAAPPAKAPAAAAK